MYEDDELSNSVQFLGIHSHPTCREETDGSTKSEETEEASIEEVIKAEGNPILPSGYQLSHCLAEGAMGRVFLVVNPKTKDCLAAKVVDVQGRASSSSGSGRAEDVASRIRAEVRHEAELQRRLKHHNIANVYGIRNTLSYTFMFMELLPGGELFDRIPVGHGLHIQQMFVYYAQILDALNYLHNDQKIAHLDVKPENVMLTAKDKAKLIDFGWAVDLKKNSFIRGPVGTTTYAAPEVFGKSSFSGPPADLFSLNVTLLTAVTGQRCWRKASPADDSVYRQWVDQRSLHTGPVFSRLPPDLINFLTRAMSHSVNERLDIEGIRSHPWFRRGLNRRLTPVTPPSNSIIRSARNNDGPVLCSQPIGYLSQMTTGSNQLPMSQPVDSESMVMASQAIYSSEAHPDDVRLGFACLMKRMTRFFSALPSLEHTMEVIRAVVIQRRQLRPIRRGTNNLLIEIKHPDHPGTSFRMLLHPLAGSILVDCRRISGDGLLFHQTYTSLYNELHRMGVVNDSHPYLRIVIPDKPKQDERTKGLGDQEGILEDTEGEQQQEEKMDQDETGGRPLQTGSATEEVPVA